MKTAEAAKGRWPEILKHYGLPPVTGKSTSKGNVRFVVPEVSFVLMTVTGAGRGFVPAAAEMV